ncbi:MAG: rhamnulose-1-phosphate aldolase [Candidatus Firestonebacteria bacterium]
MAKIYSFKTDKVLKRYAADITEVTQYLWQKGWAERNAGNLSIDITGEILAPKELNSYKKHPIPACEKILSGRIFITSITGARLRDIKKDKENTLLVVVIAKDLSGYYVLSSKKETAKKATSEFPSHLMVHALLRRTGSPKKAIIHTHPNNLIAMSQMKGLKSEAKLNAILFGMHPEVRVVLPQGVGFAPYRCPGTMDLAESTLGSIKGKSITVWEKHGVVSTGIDITEAFDFVDTIEKAADIYLLCKMAGVEPEELNKQQLKDIDKAFGN